VGKVLKLKISKNTREQEEKRFIGVMRISGKHLNFLIEKI